jgi:LSD1 subclass zinc finger protein
MSQIVVCPNCQRRLRLPEGCGSQEVRCPACQATFVAEAPQPVAVVVPIPDDEPIEDRDDSQRRKDVLRTRRRSRDKLSAPAGKGRFLIGLVGLVAGGVVAVVLLVLQAIPPPPNRAIVWEDPMQRRQELVDAFREQNPPPADGASREFKPLFDELGAACKARDHERVLDLLDFERMLDELAALEVLPREIHRQRNRLARELRNGLGKGMAVHGPIVTWVRYEIRSVKRVRDDEAVLIVRHREPEGGWSKMRWWLIRRQNGWKIYDFEDLDSAIRISATMASAAEGWLGGRAEFARSSPLFQELVQAVAARDADAAEKKLQQLAGMKLPRLMDAVRVMLTGTVQFQRGNFQAALESFDQADRLHPDMPCLDLLRGIVLNQLGRWDEAQKRLEAYRNLLGEEAVVCRELGNALSGQQRFAEACASYRKALDDDPKDADAFVGLLRALGPEEPRDDLGRRFVQLDNHRENFAQFAEECVERRDGVALEQLAQAIAPLEPRPAAVDYYHGLAKAWLLQSDAAAKFFHSALARETDPEKRDGYVRGFLHAMSQTGKTLAAYGAAPDAKAAFRLLAPELKAPHHTDELRRLVAAHRKKHADDLLLPFYEGALHVQAGNYARAEKLFTTGMARPPDATTLATFRDSRVLARFHTGQVLAAYNEIEPQHDTFLQLAALCLEEEEHEQLEALLEAHAKNRPENVDLLRFRSRLKIRQKKFAEGVELFKAVLAKQKPEEARVTISTFLADMLEAGKMLDAYQAIADAKLAFEILAGDLFDEARWPDLERLVAAHRLRCPDDVWLHYYTGELHLRDRAWDRAVQVLSEGWKKATPEVRGELRYRYALALYHTGRAQEAYRELGKEVFQQLANLMLADGKAEELEALLALHRLHAGDDPNLLTFAARLHLLRNQPAEAVSVFQKAYANQTAEWQRHTLITQFLQGMAKLGQGLEGYRVVPDKALAFNSLARHLLHEKKTEELTALLVEHRKQHAEDALAAYYTGEQHRLRGEWAPAAQQFALAVASASPHDQIRFRHALNQARVKAGQAVMALQEGAENERAFEDLAAVCLQEKDAGQLKALVTEQRKRQADDPHLVAWEVEVKWLERDHAGALALLHEHREGVFAEVRFRWKFQDRLVRCLVRLKRGDEAVREASAVARQRSGNRLLLVLAHAARGDVAGAVAALEKGKMHTYLVEQCYRDEDLGPLLRSPAFQPFRDRFPPPKPRAEEGWIDEIDF